VDAAQAALVPEADAVAEEEERFAQERAGADDTLVEPDARAAAGAAAEVRGELRTRRASHERDIAELERLAARSADLEQRAARLDAEAERRRAEVEALQAAEPALVQAMEAAQSRRQAAEAAYDAATVAQRDAEAACGAWQARVDALALALDAARARAGAEHVAQIQGVLGTLLDLVDVDPGWEAAFEAAAGEALSAVVVAGPDVARAALGHLHGDGLAGGVLALGAALPARTAPPVGEAVRRHVRGPAAAVDRLLDAIVGDAVAVSGGWAEALDAAMAHPGATVVTADGDRFGTTWRVGQGGAGATGAALEDARRHLATADAARAGHEDAVQRARVEREAARVAEEDATASLDAHDGRFGAASGAVSRAQTEILQVAGALGSARAQRTEVAERVERDRARLDELARLLDGLEADEAAEADAARARHEIRARLDDTASRLAARRRDLAVRAAGLDERQAFLERRLAGVEDRLRADADARASAEEQRMRLERSLVAVERLGAVVHGHRVAVEARLAVLQEERRRQSDAVKAATSHLESLRRRRGEAERSLEEQRERARRAELEEAEVRTRLEGAVETLRRDLDVEPEVAMAAVQPELAEGVTAAARARDLDRDLRLMGPINPLALEEFTALQERHHFLEAQLEDVRATRRELTRVIRAIDAEIQSVFASAYADVSENFSALFSTLFPGGSGRLVLTNPDDLLSTGIEVEAKPSGKNVKKLSLLSGGERSLTALAFLFAVFRSRPSPFYVMDEVEAALDDVNLHRFLDLVREFRDEAQLIVVSHQKRTMEAADCLLGVSMQPGASSKVLVEKRSEAP
jgi:chromosome segregation protein